MSIRSLLISPLLVLPVACGQDPATVSQEPEEAPAVDPHASLEMVETTFSGVVRLKGELADQTEGFLFVSVLPVGTRIPLYSTKIVLASAESEMTAEGDRLIAFHIDDANALGLGGDMSSDHVLEAILDIDGYVETDDVLGRASVPTKAGDSDLELVLEQLDS